MIYIYVIRWVRSIKRSIKEKRDLTGIVDEIYIINPD